ncbi:MAG: hydroxysqualene dehydroxylase HpnE [Acidimicrobiales bacterium]
MTAGTGGDGPLVVVGGGLAGMATALEAAAGGAEVVLVERRAHLGGLTWSFERKGRSFDNGQHVFMRCCTAYRAFLARIGAADQVHLQPRLDVPVLSPGGRQAHIARSAAPLPSPLHLAPSLLTYRHLGLADRLGAGRVVSALRRLRLDDPALDDESFGAFLARHGQSTTAIERLWDLVVLPTVNIGAADASLALAAKVFRTGLLDSTDGGDIGWSRVPLGELHGRNGAQALARAGVEVVCSTTVEELSVHDGGVTVAAGTRRLRAGAVVVALSHDAAASLLPPGAIGDVSGLGHSPIVNVHLVVDRKVTDLAFAAAIGSPVQFVFDRTDASGTEAGTQCLVVSLSAATAEIGTRPDTLVRRYFQALGDLFPMARRASLLDGVVSREHAATFRALPGTQALRPGPVTNCDGVYVAGAWCATGWPATMEGAVRSGNAAAAAAAGHRTSRPLEGVPA